LIRVVSDEVGGRVPSDNVNSGARKIKVGDNVVYIRHTPGREDPELTRAEVEALDGEDCVLRAGNVILRAKVSECTVVDVLGRNGHYERSVQQTSSPSKPGVQVAGDRSKSPEAARPYEDQAAGYQLGRALRAIKEGRWRVAARALRSFAWNVGRAVLTGRMMVLITVVVVPLAAFIAMIFVVVSAQDRYNSNPLHRHEKQPELAATNPAPTNPTPTNPTPTNLSPQPEPPPTLTPLQLIEMAGSFRSAFSIAKPFMDYTPDKQSDGTYLLQIWAAKHMTWSDIGVPKDETSFALIQKDVDEELGKRMCAAGWIIEIDTERTDYGKVFHGLLHSWASNIYAFEAVGSSGSLVEHSNARFCGVVTGRHDYSNSSGGVSHAITLVGMFDLPQNRSSRGE
jgi:hypothetical protein